MSVETEDDNEQPELMGISKKVEKLVVSISVVAIGLAILIYAVSFLNSKTFASPKEMEADFLLTLGCGLLVLMYFPWSRLKFLGLEIENNVDQEMQRLSVENLKLKEELTSLKAGSPVVEPFDRSMSEQREFIDPDAPDLAPPSPPVNENRDLILDFLENWSTWGFTPTRIKHWGGGQPGYSKLDELSVPVIRDALTGLLAENKVRTRLSKRGNLLYQVK